VIKIKFERDISINGWIDGQIVKRINRKMHRHAIFNAFKYDKDKTEIKNMER
jgi:hypothetical protein